MKARSLILILLLALLLPFTAMSEKTETDQKDSKKTEPTEEKKSETKPLELDQILAKYYDAIGGLEKWQKLNTMVMEGTMNSQGTSMPIIAYHERPNKCRVEFTVKDTMMAQIFSGIFAWQINPLSGNPEPAPMTKAKTNYMRDTCDIESSLIDYKKKNYTVKLLGEEDIKGKKAYKISVKYRSGNLETYYIDAETFLLKKTAGIYKMDGNAIRTTTNFTQYRDTNGYVVPYYLVIEIHGAPGDEILKIDKFAFNTKIDSNMFEFPKDKIIDATKKE
ncbi:MAG: hypothetical protein DHS20C13_02240 [Thermodesulfobacteriota bacterium]|nr:MAG: hypothetical protein DHS20C13_02240 [Thermodesulfobacteriota bacterium]